MTRRQVGYVPRGSKTSGHCLCGKVTYTADVEPVAQALCHCTDCQLEPSVEVFTRSALPWSPRLDKAMQFETLPGA